MSVLSLLLRSCALLVHLLIFWGDLYDMISSCPFEYFYFLLYWCDVLRCSIFSCHETFISHPGRRIITEIKKCRDDLYLVGLINYGDPFAEVFWHLILLPVVWHWNSLRGSFVSTKFVKEPNIFIMTLFFLTVCSENFEGATIFFANIVLVILWTTN